MRIIRRNTNRKFALVLAALMVTPFVMAADQTRDQDRVRDAATESTQRVERQQLRDRDIYGHQLMTLQERNEFRARMRAAKTVEERERIRAEHHEQMVVRAKERGITLPEVPPAGRGPGMGSGMGMGSGAGMSGGMSSGGSTGSGTSSGAGSAGGSGGAGSGKGGK